jgi:hypothetical protein
MKHYFSRISILIVACLIVISPSIGSTQTTTTESTAGGTVRFEQSVFGVGLAASLCSGMGLSFKHHVAKIPFAYQISGGVFKSSGTLLWDIGAELQYDLTVTATNRLYAVGGLGYYYKGDSTNELAGPTRFGIGVGYEFQLSTSINLSLNLMFTAFVPSGQLLPLPSGGLHVYFK